MPLSLADDMTDIFLEAGFEENIAYTPSGGVATTIEAIVDRGGSRQTKVRTRPGAEMDNRSFAIEIWIAVNDIASVTLDEDKVELAARIGDTATLKYRVRGVIDNDLGAWHLGLGN